MNFKKIYNKFILGAVAVASFSMTGCVNDLDTSPIDPRVEVSDNVYKNQENYLKVLSKVYGNLSLSGQKGPSGDGDINGIDEGHGQFLRGLFYAMEYPTDEANNCWQNEFDLSFGYTTLSYAASNGYVTALYSRIFIGVSYANEFIRESTDDKLAARGVTDQAFINTIKGFRAEARFLRALYYWYAIDLFGNVPFVTEADPVGSFNPQQKKKAEIFQYVVDELTEITDGSGDEKLVDSAPYGRAGKYAAYMLLSKLFLNKNVYTFDYDGNSTIPARYPSGVAADYTEAARYAKLVIDNGGYTLNSDYANNFRADNHLSPELIFTVPCDGARTQSFGAMTFVLSASLWTDWSGLEDNYGTSNAWGGHRSTEEFVAKFAEGTDTRAMFNRELMRPTNDDIYDFKSGVGVVKYKNLDQSNTIGKNKSHPDIDFPLFRLSDAMLMYAEAVARGGTGDRATATTYLNQIRTRANQGDISDTWSVADLLDERARELYWECHRRTDLIRYGVLTSSEYVWPYKGNSETGAAVESYKNLFPIPQNEIGANPTLTQNPGY
ncbi:RagB/SusD family nutrient uptake outer membrane protein [Flammeovirga aprica]|uniref:RagB/SusD family nutrient uptake outer membrane protein n=1 Tax=Flammeovirga aprica JL-4 TaxID=694437 RepID=A0A7X9RSW3_9BACT|nr:RagB/SusD family nutrient uptake outer membrane protein [Flammeovirga aprica]NME67725.1 RagB/SusD family nutrient uptake outer membrane protein [Flammeovirga aprica JL-4]